MIVVHAAVPIDSDRREEALERVRTLAEQSRAEDGVVDYHATTDLDDPNVVRFFERYEDRAALDAHGETDHYRDWMETLPDVLGGDVDDIEVTQFAVSDAFDPNAGGESHDGGEPSVDSTERE
ncbi:MULTISPECIES: putative quinol monooxygenase [Halorussus]|uniref:putative quinol monooxygenase n=1 Tax=Halorussus TaxID=1070314 RepID=UPI000E2105F5|nr:MULTISPECIES: putative quinol monooxygenase [Halorussus]NHN57708.1 antibiotic biosynthesis monooxygenase [Halorussus sp. JP-T4]